MTKTVPDIQRLIDELCPEGVEFKAFGEVVKILRGKRLTKNQLSDEEKYPVYHGGLKPIGNYGQSNRIANTVMIINVGASAGTVGYTAVDFWSSDGCFCVGSSDSLISRYAYYALLCHENILRSKVRFAGIPTLDASAVESIKIPLPPLQIQEAIVDILDTFTMLEAELEAELEARKKQYEYYRDELLTFGEEVEWKTLGEIAGYSKTRIEATDLDATNYVGVDNLLPDKQGKTISDYVPVTGRLTQYIDGDILLGNIRPYLRKIWRATNTGGTNGDVLVIRISDNEKQNLCPDFLYHILSSEDFMHYNIKNSKGAKMPRGNKSAVMKYKIPIPPLAEQEPIVATLDKFDALVNDISVGLPAEIKARRQQYEYYRDKLLTFPEKACA